MQSHRRITLLNDLCTFSLGIRRICASGCSSINAKTSEIAKASKTRWPASVSSSVRGFGVRVVEDEGGHFLGPFIYSDSDWECDGTGTYHETYLLDFEAAASYFGLVRQSRRSLFPSLARMISSAEIGPEVLKMNKTVGSRILQQTYWSRSQIQHFSTGRKN